jgi:hypothetical protein
VNRTLALAAWSAVPQQLRNHVSRASIQDIYVKKERTSKDARCSYLSCHREESHQQAAQSKVRFEGPMGVEAVSTYRHS